jgi:hypothetical protein
MIIFISNLWDCTSFPLHVKANSLIKYILSPEYVRSFVSEYRDAAVIRRLLAFNPSSPCVMYHNDKMISQSMHGQHVQARIHIKGSSLPSKSCLSRGAPNCVKLQPCFPKHHLVRLAGKIGINSEWAKNGN